MNAIIEDFGTGYVAYCPLCYARLGYEVEHVTTCPECGVQVAYSTDALKETKIADRRWYLESKVY